MTSNSPKGKFNFYSVSDVSTHDKNSQTFYLKTARDGKLFKGTINNAFLKTTLGSIPSKNEKIIIRNIIPKRYKQGFPGPGSYRTEDKFKNIKEHKIKGYGNGFLSSSTRFEEEKYYKNFFSPGPGEYSPQEERKKKSFNTTSGETIKLKQKINFPGPGSYFNDNGNQDDFLNTKMSHGSSVFMSSTLRGGSFNNLVSEANPGPGDYFDNFYVNVKQYGNKEELSPFFRNPIEKRISKEKIFNIDNGDYMNYKYKLINKKGEIKTIWGSQVESDKLFSKKRQNRLKKNRDINFCIGEPIQNKKYVKKMSKDESLDKKEKNIKTEAFYLACPRWKMQSLPPDYKVPGPAYYFPEIEMGKKKFNQNKKKLFI